MSAPVSIGAIDLGDELVARLTTHFDVTSSTPAGGSIASACAAPIVISRFGDDTELWSATTGPDRILASLQDDAVHVTTGLHGRTAIEAIAREHEQRGCHFVAAPILVATAPDGTPTAVLGGTGDGLAKVLPVFAAMRMPIAATCGRAGDAALLAIAHAAMVASAMEAIAEAFALVRKFAVEPGVLRDVIADTLFAGTVYGRLADAMLTGMDDNLPSAVRGVYILDLALEAATSGRVPLASVDACRDRLLSAIARGSGESPWTVVAREQARASGLD